jgi:hypothetical protein
MGEKGGKKRGKSCGNDKFGGNAGPHVFALISWGGGGGQKAGGMGGGASTLPSRPLPATVAFYGAYVNNQCWL